MFHRRLNEVIIGWLDEIAVLREYIDYSTATVTDVALDTSGESDVIGGQNKNFEVHHLTEPFLKNRVNTFKHNNGRCLDHLDLGGALVCREIITRDLAVLAI